MVCACLPVQPMSPLVNANVQNCFVATTVLPFSVLHLFHINLQTNKKNAEVTKEEIVTASKIQKRKRAIIAYMESTVVDISIPPPSFKPVALPLPRSPLFKTPKQVFFNPIKYIFDIFYTTLFYYYQFYFFSY